MSGKISDMERWQMMTGFEAELWDSGVELVAGLDEAGRGPLAGPVTAGAVILPANAYIPGLNDSKQLSAKRRAALEESIKQNAVAWAWADVGPDIIDEINILEASRLAMLLALEKLAIQPRHLLIDAMSINSELPQTAIVKGDSRSVSIAAASIIAKNHRDRLMEGYDQQWPQYGFAKHKGYPTAEHKARLMEYGPCPIHRRSFRY